MQYRLVDDGDTIASKEVEFLEGLELLNSVDRECVAYLEHNGVEISVSANMRHTVGLTRITSWDVHGGGYDTMEFDNSYNVTVRLNAKTFNGLCSKIYAGAKRAAG